MTSASLSRARAAFATAALATLLVMDVVAADEQPPTQRILIVQSLSRGNVVLDGFTGHFRVELDRRAGTPLNVVQVVVAPTGLDLAPEQALVGYIRSIFPPGREPDLIVTAGGPAAVFARKYRRHLFPDKPLLLASVDPRYLRAAPLAKNETAVTVVNDPSLIVEDILQLLPDTRRVFMVMGSGTIGRYWRGLLEKDFKRFHDRVTFVWDDGLTLSQILSRCASLPPNAAILYFTFGTDALGAAYADERVLADLHSTANAPMFGAHSVMLGYGIVGGRLMSIEDLARNSADAAVRILNGAPPASITVPPQVQGHPQFDWRELQRWNVAESRLPAGSVVRYRPPRLWDQHRLMILSTVAALLLQSLLILALMRERRARQRAEIEGRKSLSLAADVSRRQTMSALTNSMAHEIGQPLSSMMYDTQALQLLIAAETSDVAEILADIHAQGLRAQQIIDRHRVMLRSRHVERRAVDVHTVIEESLALVAHDVKERQIAITLDLSTERCEILGDPVLLQQVVINLVMNAMDAMDGMPATWRRITIRSEVREADVEISVRDSGPGVAASVIDNLFSPFVTTKSHGLGIGLTIARTIVDAHGGTIEARNNPDGGATVSFTLRRGETTGVMPSANSAA